MTTLIPRRAIRSRLGAASALALTLLPLGCDKDLSSEYTFIVRVTSEPGLALDGARATLRGKDLGTSDTSGALTIKIRGREGDVLPIQVTCPAGHRAPPPVQIPLRHLADGIRPEFAATCTPTTHSLVIAVRAEHGPNLPLTYLGRELARTDTSGAAHLMLDVASEDVVELVLDTSDQPRLRPRSPILRIQTGGRDEVMGVSQEFTVLKPPVVKRAVKPVGPIRLD